ncbi:MAG: hypothetical protein WCX28_06500 [Bacteriovoracaceae bacterium]
MKHVSILFTLFVLFIAPTLFVAATPAPTAEEEYVSLYGVVRYNAFPEVFKLWNGPAYGGTVSLVQNGVTLMSCPIGAGGTYNFTTDLPDNQNYELTVVTSILDNGSGPWSGSTAFTHAQGTVDVVDINALIIVE